MEPTRYPLAWPPGKPRTAWQNRKRGQFQFTPPGAAKPKLVTRVQAMKRLQAEVERLGGVYPLISSNLELRKDGEPRLDRAEPGDPGVSVYFSMDGQPYAMACDTFDSLAQNVAAIAGHIEATRRITRYGVATAAETLQAFSALPPPSAAGQPVKRSWRAVLGFSAHFPDGLTASEARNVLSDRYRERAKLAHADAGGSDAAMAELNGARDEALKELAR